MRSAVFFLACMVFIAASANACESCCFEKIKFVSVFVLKNYWIKTNFQFEYE